MTSKNASTLVPQFVQSCERFPGEIALVFADRTVTYGEFGGLVQGIRERIEATVSADEQRIAVHATQDLHTYASILAILASGKTYVPLNPRNPPVRNASCLEQADVRTMLRSSEAAALEAWLAESGMQIGVVDTVSIAPVARMKAATPAPRTSVAYILFTSGSTGAPKGVPVYHRNLDHFLACFVNDMGFDFRPTDRFLQMFDLTFDLSVMSFGVPLAIGAACHVVPPEGPGFLSVARTLQRGKVSVALMVPSVLSFLERYFDQIRLPDLRYSLFCGEALPQRVARKWRACAPTARVFNVYGPTEATIFCSSYEMEETESDTEHHRGVLSIGKPMPGTEFSVVDENLADVRAGEQGELLISGPQVTDQYWRNPEKTAAAFVTAPSGKPGYRTGDVVFESSGNYFYCGRADHQLKVDGYRVEAGEVEHHARTFEGVSDAVLVGHADAAGKTALHLFVQVTGGVPDDFRKSCKAHLAAKLPPYMVPQKIWDVKSFPLNQNGKIDRKALAAQLAAT